MNPNLMDDDELAEKARAILGYIDVWGPDSLPESEEEWSELSDEAAALSTVARHMEERRHVADDH